MRRHSLGRMLARQWMAFTAALTALFVALTLLLLFVLEDSFIDRRLHTVAASITEPAATPLPTHFKAIAWPDLPDDVRTRLHGKRTGSVIEFRRADGRYMHALAASTASGQPYALLYDVTGELTVNPGLARGFGYGLALLAALMLGAYLLARMFAMRTTRRAQALIAQVLASPDPDRLETLAQHEPVQEFADLAQLHARVWREQLAAVERERETLAFLGHELRTPLQSARTSMDLLAETPDHPAAWARLRRAVDRLVRGSTAILWLSADDAPAATNRIDANECLSGLIEEMRPLAQTRGQTLSLDVMTGLQWTAPREVIETLVANLLLNAIQHGAAGRLSLHADADRLILCNLRADTSEGGFGLGLNIARRLAARIGWKVDLSLDAQNARVAVTWDAPADPPDRKLPPP